MLLNQISQLFIGQVMGTSVGTKVFVEHGWRACSLLLLALQGFQMLVLLLRGPHCPRKRWFGYEGGLEARKRVALEKENAQCHGGVQHDPEALMRNGEDMQPDKSCIAK
jgi:hypothetical protein